MPRPIRAEIDEEALRANLRVARRAAPRARVWSVLKADAYGHGLLRAAAALAPESDGFAVIDFEDAARLREAGFSHPILMLEGPFEPADLAFAERLGLTLVVHDREQVAMIERRRPAAGLDIHVKINTGMNRLGFAPEAFPDVVRRLRDRPGVGNLTLMTHFADADGPSGVLWQMERFERAAAGLILPKTLANSAAILRYPESHGDWIRPGILLYGASPGGGEPAAAHGLVPAMTLSSRIIGIQEVPPGGTVGYGRTFTADRSIRIGIVACGYADGYPRTAPPGTPVLVAGRRTRIVGRVSMDMLTVDLMPVPEAQVGSPVELWGRSIPVDEVAAAVGTIGYELLTKVTARVPRVDAGPHGRSG